MYPHLVRIINGPSEWTSFHKIHYKRVGVKKAILIGNKKHVFHILLVSQYNYYKLKLNAELAQTIRFCTKVKYFYCLFSRVLILLFFIIYE